MAWGFQTAPVGFQTLQEMHCLWRLISGCDEVLVFVLQGHWKVSYNVQKRIPGDIPNQNKYSKGFQNPVWLLFGLAVWGKPQWILIPLVRLRVRYRNLHSNMYLLWTHAYGIDHRFFFWFSVGSRPFLRNVSVWKVCLKDGSLLAPICFVFSHQRGNTRPLPIAECVVSVCHTFAYTRTPTRGYWNECCGTGQYSGDCCGFGHSWSFPGGSAVAFWFVSIIEHMDNFSSSMFLLLFFLPLLRLLPPPKKERIKKEHENNKGDRRTQKQ